ncbi:DUF1003 domain-containing protein [Streptococcus dentiloxodontae]
MAYKIKKTEDIKFGQVDLNLRKRMLRDFPDLIEDSIVSPLDLMSYRLDYLDEVIDKANKKNDYVKATVFDVTKDREFSQLDVQEQLDRKITFGQKVADDVARFGGSWTFIISFIIFMAVWMAINVIRPFGIAFDTYPFILLNLALSTIAAIQAPLIMMSQNRASDYDRLQAKNDYLVNKTSEEEIRLLHTKLDHLVQQDQSDLLVIQKLQSQMIASLGQQVEELKTTIEMLGHETKERKETDVR